MPNPQARFVAHVRDGGGTVNRALPGASTFIEAALLFAENAVVDHETRVSVEITDHETGKSRCFVIDLENAQVRAC